MSLGRGVVERPCPTFKRGESPVGWPAGKVLRNKIQTEGRRAGHSGWQETPETNRSPTNQALSSSIKYLNFRYLGFCEPKMFLGFIFVLVLFCFCVCFLYLILFLVLFLFLFLMFFVFGITGLLWENCLIVGQLRGVKGRKLALGYFMVEIFRELEKS